MFKCYYCCLVFISCVLLGKYGPIFSPPENDSFRKDLCFSPDVLFIFYFFSEREISEMRGPTGAKFCTMVSTRPNFIMLVQNFGARTPKNMQNLTRFRTTSKFGGEYLRNG